MENDFRKIEYIDKISTESSPFQLITKILLSIILFSITYYVYIKDNLTADSTVMYGFSALNSIIAVLPAFFILLIPLLLIKNLQKRILLSICSIIIYTYFIYGSWAFYYFDETILDWVIILTSIIMANLILELTIRGKFVKIFTILLSFILIINLFILNNTITRINNRIINHKAGQDVAVSDSWVSANARDSSNPSLCYKIQDSFRRDLCLYYIIEQTKKYNLCAELTDNTLKKNCTAKCFTSYCENP